MLNSDHLTADQALVLRGVLDGLNALPPLYSQEEMDKASLRVQRYAANRRRGKLCIQSRIQRVADENLARSQALLEENGAIEGTETLSNGIEVKVLKDGAGRVLGNAKSMTVNCQITLADGTLVRSTEEGKPLTVQCSKMLPEVVAAMEGMQVGAKWKIVVPPRRPMDSAARLRSSVRIRPSPWWWNWSTRSELPLADEPGMPFTVRMETRAMKFKQLLSSTSATLIAATVMLCCARQCRAQSDGLPGLDDQVMTARQQYDAALSQLVQIRAQQMQQARVRRNTSRRKMQSRRPIRSIRKIASGPSRI